MNVGTGNRADLLDIITNIGCEEPEPMKKPKMRLWHRCKSAWACLLGRGTSRVSITFLQQGQTRGYSRRFFLTSGSSFQDYKFRLGGREGVVLEGVEPPFGIKGLDESLREEDPMKEIDLLRQQIEAFKTNDKTYRDRTWALVDEVSAMSKNFTRRLRNLEYWQKVACEVKPTKKKAAAKKVTKKAAKKKAPKKRKR